jgi:hypothetical protein
MSVPVEMTAVAGAILTAVQWNSNVRDGINYIITPPLVIVRQNSAQTIANITWTAITWNTEIVNRDGMHSTSVNPTRFTINTPGFYHCKSILAWTQSSSNVRASKYATNGSTESRGASSQAAGNLTVGQMLDATIYYNTGDYAEVYGYHSSGGSTTTATLSDFDSMMSLQWISTA